MKAFAAQIQHDKLLASRPYYDPFRVNSESGYYRACAASGTLSIWKISLKVARSFMTE